MNYRFIYCNDESVANELAEKLKLINIQTISEKKTWIFQNDNEVLKFSNAFNFENQNKVKFTNKLFI